MYSIPEINAVYVGTRKGPYLWELTKPLIVTLADGVEYTVPEGYRTNFASIPPALQGIIPTMGPGVSIASAPHDHMYETHYREDLYGEWQARKLADDDFLFLLNQGAPDRLGRNRMMYDAVRVFGRKAWRNAKRV